MSAPHPKGRKDRDASAVLLVRGVADETELFLVERAPELRFFGGYLALPGGVRDPEDFDDSSNGETAFRRCAARELFEETGVLLGGAGTSGTDRKTAREALLTGDRAGWDALQADSSDTLESVCRIRTPPFAPVRYDTLFFLARLPEHQTPSIWPGELTGGRFWRPADALAAWRRGELLIVPPVIILLELMVDRDLGDFVAAAQRTADEYRDGVLHRVQFSPGIIMASLQTPTLPPATTTNCLIVGDETLFIVDPATPDAAEQQRLFQLLDALRDEGHALGAVLLTHHHHDHVAAAAPVSQRYGIPVRGHQLTLDRLEGDAIVGPAIDDGDRIDLGRAPDGTEGWHLRALFTPGHDRGHLCFHESRYSALVAGDMVSTVSTIIIDPPEGHMATYLRSLQRLEREEIGTLYPAHGPAVPDGTAVVRKYLRHRAGRQQKLVDALRSGPATVEQLLPTVYDDVDPRLYGLAARSLLAGLQMLSEEGHAAEAAGVWTHTAPPAESGSS